MLTEYHIGTIKRLGQSVVYINNYLLITHSLTDDAYFIFQLTAVSAVPQEVVSIGHSNAYSIIHNNYLYYHGF